MSFFDDPAFFSAENYQLCKIFRKVDEINLSKRVLFEGELSLRPMAGVLTTKYFKILDRKLVYFSEKNVEKPKGFYDLLTYMKISSYEVYDKENEMHVYVFRLEKFGKFHEFFLKDKKIILKWIQILKLYCVSSDFDHQYEILEKVGSGHFAKVFKVLHKETDMIHAAKIMDKDKQFFEQKSYIFNEINILKTLPKNDNIIKLYEVYESLGELILIFEFMEGGDVYKKVKSSPDKKMSEVSACFIMCQTLKGLKFLHSHGVVHRDIKPENILLSDDSLHPIAKIADFSLSEHFVNKKLSVRCGTPGYMSPEMFTDEAYNEKIDVFSLGISLFIMLTGKSPFHGNNCEEVMEKNKTCNVKFKKKSWENISKDARKLTSRMITKFPGQRISLQQILIQKWIKEHFFDTKLNELLKDKLKNPKSCKLHKKEMKEKEESKQTSRKLSIKKEMKKLPSNKDHILPINSVNSLFIYSPASGGSAKSSNTSEILNLTHNSLSSSSMDLKFRSRLSSIGSASAYTFPNSGGESQDDEEQKDYVVFDGNLMKSQTINSKNTKTQHTMKQEMIESTTSRFIFDDENPIKQLLKTIIPLCGEVKHFKF